MTTNEIVTPEDEASIVEANVAYLTGDYMTIEEYEVTESKRRINDDISKIIVRLVKIFDPEKIFLFGSYAWGVPNKDSDLDLMVIVDHHEKPPHQRSTIAYREMRDILFPLDIFVKTRSEFEQFSEVLASLEHKILSQAICLYESKKSFSKELVS